MINFSVIVPTLNERVTIPILLNSLENQTLKTFEVIVVDNGSTDGTVNVIKSIKEKYPFPIRQVFFKQRGISHARNHGSKYAKGKYLIFFDADGIVHRQWIKNAADILERDSEILVLSGFLIYRHSNFLKFLLYNSYSSIGYTILIILQRVFKIGYFFLGNNMLIDKEFFTKLGKFPHIVGEDMALTQKALSSIKDHKRFRSEFNLKVYNSSRRFEQRGFISSLIGWIVDFKNKKSSSKYDVYR
ncbi:glycosyltransferase family 2 protein [Candidatus Dojkabacteria bacterium]|nr:glycosyltransferase family 2 protein [Candidatus Dojkabacteria bacterium]